jgi:thiamine biosynthesis lipoprotein ApbE
MGSRRQPPSALDRRPPDRQRLSGPLRGGTINAPYLATADAHATAAFAMDTQGRTWTARLTRYEAMTNLSEERVLSTPGFPT